MQEETKGFPNFFVVGAQKSGTTTIHDWLDKNYKIGLPKIKETHFFRDEELFSNGIDWYKCQYDNLSSVKIAGEVDPEYMFFPECVERIKTFVKAPKLIFILRDPLSRAYSHYLMSVRRGYENLAYINALLAENSRLENGDRFSNIHHSYISRGLYYKQIKYLLNEFPDSELLVLKFEDLFQDEYKAMDSLRNIYKFLDVENDDVLIDVSKRNNQSSIPRFVFIRDIIYKPNVIKKLIGKMIPSRDLKLRIMQLIERLNLKPITKNKKVLPVPDSIIEALIHDLEALMTIVEIDVSDWIEMYKRKLSK